MNDQPKWVNPCGIDMGVVPESEDDKPLSDYEVLTPFATQLRIALNAANHFKGEFAEKAFQSTIEMVNERHQGLEYSWLPRIPKLWNEPGVGHEEHLKTLNNLDNFLVDAYLDLQKLAVAWEQVVMDSERTGDPLDVGYKQQDFGLRLVLCELELAIYEKGINYKLHRDAKRDIMPDAIRNSADNSRNWIIYRNYMNTLEYLIAAVEHFINK